MSRIRRYRAGRDLGEIEPPASLEPVEILPGILWLRVDQPFALDHVNCYLVEDYGGWTLVDTGVGSEIGSQQWHALLNGPLRGTRITRILTTHAHPDHIGAAGWLSRRFDAVTYSNAGELNRLRHMLRSFDPAEASRNAAFYRLHGLAGEAADALSMQDHRYAGFVDELPADIRHLASSGVVDIGGRQFAVIIGRGHSPCGMLYLALDGTVCFSGDQILSSITPLIGVWAENADENPLDDYLSFLASVPVQISDATLVLGGHQMPFKDAAARALSIRRHHEERCTVIKSFCGDEGRSVGDIIPVLFPWAKGQMSVGFAFGEVLAHMHYLAAHGELDTRRTGDSAIQFARTNSLNPSAISMH
ncbi:MAG: MBL fold metallo-hydrolase [Rhizobiaceae bacterium]|nr:MBL fold metallo-hydrolase [Rhizobiaceae bacterium]